MLLTSGVLWQSASSSIIRLVAHSFFVDLPSTLTNGTITWHDCAKPRTAQFRAEHGGMVVAGSVTEFAGIFGFLSTLEGDTERPRVIDSGGD